MGPGLSFLGLAGGLTSIRPYAASFTFALSSLASERDARGNTVAASDDPGVRGDYGDRERYAYEKKVRGRTAYVERAEQGRL